MKKICIATATRAEYGLLKPLMQAIKGSKQLQLQVLATGAHLSPEFGLTYKTIESDGFVIDYKVEMLLSADTSSSIVKSMGLAMMGFSDAFTLLQPDALVILGDRYEMLALASAALIFKIPILHLHGGELTQGAYDDAIRHSITKMSHFHFASTEVYKNRLIQMGESPERVFNAGAIGLCNLKSEILWTKEKLESDLGLRFLKHNYQVTFHPETLSKYSVEDQFQILLEAIQTQEDSFFVFTKANADTDGRVINQMIDNFVRQYPHISSAFHSLGTTRFWSVLQLCDAIVGNSSSGIVEAPFLGVATINIGDRQKGRLQTESILNCECDLSAIVNCFDIVKSDHFKSKLKHIVHPYGDGNTANQILDVLENTDFSQLDSKTFYDVQLSF